MKTILCFLATLVACWTLQAQNFIEATQQFIQVGNSSVEFGNVRNAPSGILDLFISGRDANADAVSVLYANVGNGTFTTFPGSTLPAFSNGTAIFGDVDSDGDDDIYVSGFPQDFSEGLGNLYLNNGGGFFTPLSPSPFRELVRSAAAFANPDNDNTLDIITLGNEPSEQINGRTDFYSNINNNEFLEAIVFPLDDLKTGAVAVTDVDGDGNEDVLITGSNEMFNMPTEFITKLFRYDGLGNYVEVAGNPFVGVIHSSVDFADVDNDGDQDVFITGLAFNSQKIARLYYHIENGSYEEATDQPFTGVEFGASEFADIDGDGDQDLLVTGAINVSTANTQLFLNDGSGNFTELESDIQDIHSGDLAFYDVDRDGDQDLLISGFIDGSNVFTRLYLNEPLAGNSCDNGESVDGLFGGPVGEVQTLSQLSNVGYSSSSDPEEDCFQFDGIDASRWFTFTGDGETYRIVVPGCGSPNAIQNEDSQIILYAGSCDNLTEVACNDDEFPEINFIAGITFATEPGQTYRFFVDGYGGGFTGGGVANPEGEFCLEVFRLAPSSVTNEVAELIEIFPNPATDQVTIDLGDTEFSGTTSISLRDLAGRTVWSGSSQATIATIPTQNLTPGAYFLAITQAGQTATKRLIIQ